MATDRDDDKGFRVTDRRQISSEEAAAHEPAPAADPPPTAAAGPAPTAAAADPPPADAARPRRGPLPEIDFATFVLSLGTSALYHLGEMPAPDAEAPSRNLPLAKQSIDIIAMLREKTKGNLADGEAQLVDNLLYDLRMKYVAATLK